MSSSTGKTLGISPRDTENAKPNMEGVTKAAGTRRARGRPTGSKNKPRELIPAAVADRLLATVRPILPPEEYDKIRAAVKDGKYISSMNEAKIMLLLMRGPLWNRLISETELKKKINPNIDPDVIDEIGPEPAPEEEFAKDTNERLKVWMNLLQLVYKMEQDSDQGTNTGKKPLIELVIKRGSNAGRLAILIGDEGNGVGRTLDGIRRVSGDTGTLPDSVPERYVNVQDSEQEPPVGVLYGDIDRDSTPGDDSAQL